MPGLRDVSKRKLRRFQRRFFDLRLSQFTPVTQLVLKETIITKESAMQAANEAVANAEPLELNAYKVPIFKAVIFRTICQTVGIDPFS